ncbi:lipase [Collibacillus ludicampi]|uniref:Lipase n=1 Tax=Collibacillus ludicampi TaxID=2771369 RepID=A0AAV4LD93_9BACL|nr:SGNH/GDSL hydrolase family protein [Collibacillus ludicampi]GIM45790.1 lipase [Collibacillus ludicampi]
MAFFVTYGDSVPAGYGVPIACNFISVIQKRLSSSRNHPVQAINLSIPGLNTFGLLEMLASGDGMALLPSSSFIIVYIGGNDLIDSLPLLLSKGKRVLPKVIQMSQQIFTRTLQVIHRHTRSPILVGTLYNPFPNSPIAVEAVSLYNQQVIIPAAQAAYTRIVPVNEAFLGRESVLIQGYSSGIAGQHGTHGIEYPIHPNLAGHRVIAEQFLNCLGN